MTKTIDDIARDLAGKFIEHGVYPIDFYWVVEKIKSDLQSYGDQRLEEAAECVSCWEGDLISKQKILALKSKGGA